MIRSKVLCFTIGSLGRARKISGQCRKYNVVNFILKSVHSCTFEGSFIVCNDDDVGLKLCPLLLWFLLPCMTPVSIEVH